MCTQYLYAHTCSYTGEAGTNKRHERTSDTATRHEALRRKGREMCTPPGGASSGSGVCGLPLPAARVFACAREVLALSGCNTPAITFFRNEYGFYSRVGGISAWLLSPCLYRTEQGKRKTEQRVVSSIVSGGRGDRDEDEERVSKSFCV